MDLAGRRQIYKVPDRVNILNPYRHAGGAGLLLDTYTGAEAAYSLRKLKSTATYAIRVRRTSDDATQDIGFDGVGYLDTSSLSTFVGASDGAVSIWYDQSGNGFDMSSSGTAYQPLIMSSGALITQNSLAAIKADGSDDYMYSSAGTLSSTGDSAFSTVVVATHNDSTNTYSLFSLVPSSYSSDRRKLGFPANDSGSLFSSRIYGGNCIWNGTINGIGQFIAEQYYGSGGGSWSAYLDGTSKSVNSSSNTGLNLQSSSGFEVFSAGSTALGNASNPVNAYAQEIIWWLSDKSASRSGIYADVSAFWA